MIFSMKPGKINVKALLILAAVLVLVTGGIGSVYLLRKRAEVTDALAEGKAAFERGEMATAAKQLRTYLSKNQNDIAVLEMYAQAQMSVRPLEVKNVMQAITAYRTILRLQPTQENAYQQLTGLYYGIRNYADLIDIARMRLEQVPDDLSASIWVARCLVAQRRLDEAKDFLQDFLKKLEGRPQRYPEFIEACALQARIISDTVTEGAPESAVQETRAEVLRWLNRAVEHDPKSAEAWLQRARYQRSSPTFSKEARAQAIAAAKSDLKAADALQPADPRIRLLLSEEWMECDDLEQAVAELELVRNINGEKDKDVLKKFFIDPSIWDILLFNQVAELALRRGKIDEGVAMADRILKDVKYPQQRMLVLPTAIKLYAAAGRVKDAHMYLYGNEDDPSVKDDKKIKGFLDMLVTQGSGAETSDEVVFLQAIVARMENKPRQVVQLLETIYLRNPGKAGAGVLRLLADAYGKLGQSQRAAQTTVGYLNLRPKDGEMWLQLARTAFKLKNWPAAEEAVRKAEPLMPQSVDVRLMRIEIAIQGALEKPAAARKTELDALAKELAALRGMDPKRADIRILQAQIALRQGQSQIAEQELRQAIQECTDTLPAEMRLAELYANLKQFEKAVEVCRTACEKHPDLAAPWLALADIQRAADHLSDARAALNNGLKALTRSEEIRILQIRQALLALLSGERDTGLLQLRMLAKNNESDIEVRQILLDQPEIARQKSETDQKQTYAQTLVDEIKKVEGEIGSIWRLRQAALYLAGEDWRDKQADIKTLLDRCINSDSEWTEPVLLYGRFLERLNRLEEAQQAYERALARNPDALDVADRLVAVLRRQKKDEEAAKVLSQLQANPSSVSQRLIKFFEETGDLKQAIDQLKLRAKNDPQDVASRLALARLVYQQDKDAKAALQYLDEADKAQPDALEVLTARVRILRAESRVDEARKLLDARVSQSKSFGAYLQRAAFLSEIGEMEAAEKDYRQLAAMSAGGDGHQLLAKFLFAAGRSDEAIQVWEEGLAARSDNDALQRGLAKALVVRGRADDRARAAQLLAKLEQKSTADIELMSLRATLLLLEHKPESTEKARVLLENIVQMRSVAIDAWVTLISIAMQNKDVAAAQKLAIRAQDANPGNMALRLTRAQVERAAKNLREACDQARQVVREDAGNIEAIALLVGLASDLRDSTVLSETLAQVNEALAKNPDDERLVLAYAQIFAAQGQLDAALKKVEAYCQTEQGRRNVNTLLALADLYRMKNNFAASGEKIEQALEIAPDRQDAAQAKVRLLMAQKKFDDIAAWMESYRAKNPKAAAVFVIAATALATSPAPPHRAAALALFEQAAQAAPNLPDPLVGIALLAYQDSNIERAVEFYRKVLALAPDHVQALNDLAWILTEGPHDYAAALELANRAVQLAPDNPHILDTRGVVLTNFPERLRDARRDFEKCVEFSAPDSPARAKALLKLGRICVKLQDKEAAKKCFEEALKLDQKLNVFSPSEREEINQHLKNLSTTQ